MSEKRRQRPLKAREAALKALVLIECEGTYSNLALNRVLRQGMSDEREAALTTELVYGTIQRRNTIDYFLDRFVTRGLDKLQPRVLSLLRMSFYQLHYLQKIPDHAVVNEAVKLARRIGHRGIAAMVNGVLRAIVRSRDQLVLPESLPETKRLALVHSHPEWMICRWVNQYGWSATEHICKANNRPPLTTVRVNTLKNERNSYLQQLQQRMPHAAPSTVSPVGIAWRKGGNPAQDPDFAAGLYTIQGESSMLVGEVVDPKPGMKVLDACAAPGGKTTHLAEKMSDQGEVWANDIHEHKIKLIEDQAQRLGLSCIRTSVGDASRLREKFARFSFDRILLDAPCSGLGVIRRKPDLKWTKRETDLPDLVAMQYRLLTDVSVLLKDDGVLVYSTCTLEQKENEQLVQRFLQEHPEFEEDDGIHAQLPNVPEHCRIGPGMVRLFPHDLESDGFFIARLRKKTKV